MLREAVSSERKCQQMKKRVSWNDVAGELTATNSHHIMQMTTLYQIKVFFVFISTNKIFSLFQSETKGHKKITRLKKEPQPPSSHHVALVFALNL